MNDKEYQVYDALGRSLTTSVKNRFRRDPEILAKWKTASHIQRSPRPAQTPKQDTQPTA